MEKTEQTREAPLVSVVIPCYNHAHYLPEAIESVLQQGYPATEIVVVDDGSSDDTPQVARRYPGVRYVHQPNSGLSAARNTGIRHSTGEYLVFLDADDWLTPGSIQRNLQHLIQDPKLAFVSGAHYKIFTDGTVTEEKKEVNTEHYRHLLESNYIAMTASVMFRHWVFNQVQFDTTLKACEDYDLFLKVAREHPVCHHMEFIGAYRIHTANMSGNIPLMLSSVLKVLERQAPHLRTEQERQAYQQGKSTWIEFYGHQLHHGLNEKKVLPSKEAIDTLVKYNPDLGQEFIRKNRLYILKTRAKNYALSIFKRD